MRLAAFCDEIAGRGLDAFLVPMRDEFDNEMQAEHTRRIAWLTGFTGSAGFVIVTEERAVIYTDGRYEIQVREQTNPDDYEYRRIDKEHPSEWIAGLPKGSLGTVGYDRNLHTKAELDAFRDACETIGAKLVPIPDLQMSNPIDTIWKGRPVPQASVAVKHSMQYAGEAARMKRQRIAKILREKGVAAALLTRPDSVAWLLNIRAGEKKDVPYTPTVNAAAILYDNADIDLFIDREKVGTPEILQHLGEIGVHSLQMLQGVLRSFQHYPGARILVDRANAPAWVSEHLEKVGVPIVYDTDPCQLPKAVKNDFELIGMREAHRRDGIALTRFLSWLDQMTRRGNENITEMLAAEQLETFRKEDPLYNTPSFPTISGSAEHGAIIHYGVTPESNMLLKDGLYLCDSGGQYEDGTTDVTRTVLIGTPDPLLLKEMRQRFTAVLQGHIAISRLLFPRGTTGHQIDCLARQALWRLGLDFKHGTGHGVGAALNVHEAPPGISSRYNPGSTNVPFEPGMIVSNEPGYYKEGAYGIRIENLVEVVSYGTPMGGELEMLGFKELTLAPIDRSLIATAMMSNEEILWVNRYHQRVWETLARPIEDKGDLLAHNWLTNIATRTIVR